MLGGLGRGSLRASCALPGAGICSPPVSQKLAAAGRRPGQCPGAAICTLAMRFVARAVGRRHVAARASEHPQVNWPLWRAGGWTPNEETWQQMPLAEYWHTLAEEPLVAEDFFGRQAIYYCLIRNDALRGLFPGPQLHGCPTRHFLWAYAVQLDWQWRSGRLGEGRAISPNSWWGCVTLLFSCLGI